VVPPPPPVSTSSLRFLILCLNGSQFLLSLLHSIRTATNKLLLTSTQIHASRLQFIIALYLVTVICSNMDNNVMLTIANFYFLSRDRSVGTPTGWMAGVPLPVGVRFLFSPQRPDCSWAHLASPMGTGAFSPGVKRPGREANHSPPSSAEVKYCGTAPPLPNTSSCRGAQLIKHRVKCTF
jgi:hypothetical protein